MHFLFLIEFFIELILFFIESATTKEKAKPKNLVEDKKNY